MKVALFSLFFFGIFFALATLAHADDVDSVIDDLIAFRIETANAAKLPAAHSTPIRKSVPRLSTDSYKAEILSEHHEQGIYEITVLYFPRLSGVSYQVTLVKADDSASAPNNQRFRELSRLDLKSTREVAGQTLRSGKDDEQLYLMDLSAASLLRIQPSRPVRESQLLAFVSALPFKELTQLK